MRFSVDPLRVKIYKENRDESFEKFKALRDF